MAVRASVRSHKGAASDSEDDLATSNTAHVLSPETATENKRAKPKMTTNAKTAARRANAGKTASKRKAAQGQTRAALRDRTNLQDNDDGEEISEDEDTSKPKPKRLRTDAGPKKKTARAIGEPHRDEEPASRGAGPKRGRPPKTAQQESLRVIPETQLSPPEDEHIEQSIENLEEDGMADLEPPTAQRDAPHARSMSVQPLQPRASVRSDAGHAMKPRATARSLSAQPRHPPSRERSGSFGPTERRGGDPELRRKLNDITTKYENLHMKYQEIQEIGKKGADTNFEKLKRASDQKAKDADNLIASIRKELDDLRKSHISGQAELGALRKQVSDLTTSNGKVSEDGAALRQSLQTSQNETKSLEAKLLAARQQISSMATSHEQPKIPSSATKGFSRGVIASNASDAQKEARMKENLYSDLTGLIICGVKRKEGEDEYDCIQTGRNGTLHFHLSIANDSGTANPKTPSGLSYEEAEFAYEPLLDDSRDRGLVDLLPDYLTEEICFPRNHAVKFYSRVVDSMTKKIVVEDEG